MKNNKVSLAGIIETRVKESNLKATIKGIAPGWGIMHNYNANPNGRIWVVWDDNWYETKYLIILLK